MRGVCSLILLILFPLFLRAEEKRDTLYLNIAQAEKLFIDNNIQLLAQKYSIDSAKASVITAKLYDNPDFNINTGFYQSQTKRFFDYSQGNGEIMGQVSQLIKTAGKRGKNIAVARTGVVITEYEFSDMVRTLGYTLRNDFYNIHFLLKTAQVYDVEIKSLRKTTDALRDQVGKGFVAPKDLIRVQTQLYTLEAELTTLQNSIEDVQSELKLLIRARASVFVVPMIETENPTLKATSFSSQSLVDSAFENRYDLKIAKATVTLSYQNLALQKALAVPDFSVILGYDRLGSYVNDFNSVGIDMPLPFFNRNQGNIKQARTGIKTSELMVENQQNVIESQINNAYIAAIRAEKLVGTIDPSFEDNFKKLIEEVTRNFDKHNITVLEFIDFYDSYKQNAIQLNTLRYNNLSKLEELNFTTGTRIFNK